MRLQCFLPTRYVMGEATSTYKRDDHYQNLVKMVSICIVWSYYAVMWTMQYVEFFWTIFFSA